MKQPTDPDTSGSDPDIESVLLRTLVWQPVPTAVLQRSLHAALAAARPEPARRRILTIPRALRWPLAACWAASLALRLTTPADAVPTGSPALAIRVGDGPSLFAILESNRQKTHAILLDLQSSPGVLR